MSGSTLQTSEFIDEKFEIVPGIKPYTPPTEGTPAAGKEGIAGKKITIIEPLTDEEALNFVKGILSLPHIFLSKLPPRTDEQLKPFVHELNLYCNLKKIDLRSYFFDEFGLVVTFCALGYGYVEDYRTFYGKDNQKKSKEDRHLDADYDHAKEVEEKNKQAKENEVLKDGST